MIKGNIMEPNLEDIEDYNKPLKKSKLKAILIFFGVLIVLYGLSALVQSSM